ncbi:hypothetical protein NEOLEDRAFT_416005 [Neolentinus lepideus HHB14362 ss-1]|uniref:Uncharacterized protein n=1 Tax=Neolentinus lepideus HHB14362 ss-1 TaxID=1314782 RepID=A0A165RYP1_9AGAM|nr:hypothetical protein NEOLEDRAFT_416005 [Neolentinus lepideus HHB14362 ss-1]
MVPTSMAPSDFRTHSMAPSDADFRPHSIGPTSIAPSEFSESRIPRVQRLDDPRSTIYGTIPEEEDDETARTVSDGYVDIGRHPQEQYYHEAGPSQHHEAGTSRYHESGSPQYTEYRPGEHHHSHSRPRPAYHNQAPEQPSMRHGSSRRQTDHEPTVLDYRSQATSYMPSHAQPHIPTYGPDTSSQPQMRQPAPPQDRAFHIPPPGTYEYERAPTGMEGARGEFARQPRRQAQYNQTPGHTTQHVPSREYVQPLIHTVSRRRSAETYYIIPNNKPVIFKDERGNEIARVGDFSGRRRSRRKHPLIIQDEYGRELYR